MGEYGKPFDDYFNNIIDQKLRWVFLLKNLGNEGAMDGIGEYLTSSLPMVNRSVEKLGGFALSTIKMTSDVRGIWKALDKINEKFLYDVFYQCLHGEEWDDIKYFMKYHGVRAVNFRTGWSEEKWNQLRMKLDNIYKQWIPYIDNDKNIINTTPIKDELRLLIALTIKGQQEQEQYKIAEPFKEQSFSQRAKNKLNNAITAIKNTPKNISNKVSDFFSRRQKQAQEFLEQKIKQIERFVQRKTEQKLEEELKKQCFIATAVYGTPDAPEIEILRDFRDEVLLENYLGKELVGFYYQTSPLLAKFISQHSLLRKLIREIGIEPLVWTLKFSNNVFN